MSGRVNESLKLNFFPVQLFFLFLSLSLPLKVTVPKRANYHLPRLAISWMFFPLVEKKARWRKEDILYAHEYLHRCHLLATFAGGRKDNPPGSISTDSITVHFLLRLRTPSISFLSRHYSVFSLASP